MSSTEGLEDRAERIEQNCFCASPRSGERAGVLLLGVAIAVVLALLFIAGYRFASIWSALAIVAWMFLAGAARASSE